MKRACFLLLFSVFIISLSNAQIRTPETSPAQRIIQTVGVTEVSVEYSRPSVKNRVVFGDLVPYNQLWRTGANWNTKISFDDAITVGGVTLEPGSYALYTIPNPFEWEIIFYKDTTNWGLPEEWNEDLVAVRLKSQVKTLPINFETFTIGFDSVMFDSANLQIVWEKTYVSIPLFFHTDAIVAASIEETLQGPKASDYYAAAVYYLETDKNMNQARDWINTAIDMMGSDAEYFVYRQQALIYAKLGNRKEAIKAAEKSLKLAEDAGNMDYVRLNKRSLEAWRS